MFSICSLSLSADNFCLLKGWRCHNLRSHPESFSFYRSRYREVLSFFLYNGFERLGAYDFKPRRFLERVYFKGEDNPSQSICCAGFELNAWRCAPFADHLMEWLPEYALPEEELRVNHGNIYVKLKQAAIRVYSSPKYKRRGEAGEIALHAVCRDYFGTLPISPRVFYKSTSNDVVKAFDLVHARIPPKGNIEIWLGESKLYGGTTHAVSAAIESISEHLEKGFLQSQKLFLGPQIPKSTPRYNELMELFEPQTSLDKFLSSAVFVVGILSNSKAAQNTKKGDGDYKGNLETELQAILKKLDTSKLSTKIRLALFYVPLATKDDLVKAFDTKLKALQ